MSTKPRYALDTPETQRNLTADLWRQSLDEYVTAYPEHGVKIDEDFADYVSASSTGTASVGGSYSVDREGADADGTASIVTQDGPDGVALVSSSTTTNHNGVSVQRLPAVVVTPKHASTPRGRLVFEAIVDVDAAVVFVGLTPKGDQFLSSTSTLPTTVDYIGFLKSGSAYSFVSRRHSNTTSDSFAIPAALLADGSKHKLGFAVNVDGSIDIAVDGRVIQKTVNKLSDACIPNVSLVPRVSATTGTGNDAPSVSVDYLKVFVAGTTL